MNQIFKYKGLWILAQARSVEDASPIEGPGLTVVVAIHRDELSPALETAELSMFGGQAFKTEADAFEAGHIAGKQMIDDMNLEKNQHA